MNKTPHCAISLQNKRNLLESFSRFRFYRRHFSWQPWNLWANREAVGSLHLDKLQLPAISVTLRSGACSKTIYYVSWKFITRRIPSQSEFLGSLKNGKDFCLWIQGVLSGSISAFGPPFSFAAPLMPADTVKYILIHLSPSPKLARL